MQLKTNIYFGLNRISRNINFFVNKKGYMWRFYVMKGRFMVFFKLTRREEIYTESNQTKLYFCKLHGDKLYK